MPYDDKEIKQVLKEERSRGKAPPVPEEIYKARLKQLKDFRKALLANDWELFKEQLTASGLKAGTRQWNDAVEIWNQHHGARYRE